MIRLTIPVFLVAVGWRVDIYASNVDIPPAYRQIATVKQVPADILYAIAITESRYGYRSALTKKTIHQPWPWSLNIDGVGVRFQRRVQAYRALQNAVEKGSTVDVGLLQINRRWHGQRFNNLWSMLDPYKNISVGADILKEQHLKTSDWWTAVGAYHAPGSDKASLQRAKQYRQRVRKNWRLITARGHP